MDEYSTFDDIEDATLRNRNRAVVMNNMLEFNSRDGKVTDKGRMMLQNYFDMIPLSERYEVMTNLEELR
jgi:hypothetical protein